MVSALWGLGVLSKVSKIGLTSAAKVAVLFLAISVGWIVLTDYLVGALAETVRTQADLQTAKGLLFVLGSSAIIFFLVWGHSRRLRASQAETQEAKDLLFLSLEASGNSAFSYAVASNSLEAVPGFSSLIGQDKPVMSRDQWMDLIHPEDRAATAAAVERHIADNTPRFEATYRVRHKDGDERWVMSRGRAIRDDAGAITRVVGVHTEISEREHLREQIERTNRALRALVQANRAIIFAQDEASLLEAVCRVLADVGEFPLVWIGKAERDEAKTVSVAACAGTHADLPRKAYVSWSSSVPEGRGLVGTAVRTGKWQYASDVGTDARLAAWHEEVVFRGLGPEIVVPIGPGELTWGVLSVYGKTAEALEGTDADMLINIGEDIWYAICAITRDLEFQVLSADKVAIQQRAAIRERELLEKTIEALARTIEKRDPFTAGHQRRVADLANAIAHRMDLPQARIDDLRLGALIHDIGKIAVPTDILTKPSALTSQEFALVQTHAQAGYDIVSEIGLSDDIVLAVLEHHERLDGSGYPSGLVGQAVSLSARIVAVADTVEAMTARRPYRDPVDLETVLAILEEGRETKFDPAVVDACRQALFDDGLAELMQLETRSPPPR